MSAIDFVLPSQTFFLAHPKQLLVFMQLNDSPVPQAKRDLLIMLDESGSVGSLKFQKLKRIGAAIVKCEFCF